MANNHYNLKRLNEISKFDEIELLILEKKLEDLFKDFNPSLLNESKWASNFMKKAKSFISGLSSGAKSAYEYVKKKTSFIGAWLKNKLKLFPKIKIGDIREAIGFVIGKDYVEISEPNPIKLESKLKSAIKIFKTLVTENEIKREMAIVSDKTGDITDTREEVDDVIVRIAKRKADTYIIQTAKIINTYLNNLAVKIDEFNEKIKNENLNLNQKKMVSNIEIIKQRISDFKPIEFLTDLFIKKNTSKITADQIKVNESEGAPKEEENLKEHFKNIQTFIILEKFINKNNKISILLNKERKFSSIRALLEKKENDSEYGVSGFTAALNGLAEDDGNWNKWLTLALILGATAIAGAAPPIAAAVAASLGLGLKTVGQMSKSYTCNKLMDDAAKQIKDSEFKDTELIQKLNKISNSSNCNFRVTLNDEYEEDSGEVTTRGRAGDTGSGDTDDGSGSTTSTGGAAASTGPTGGGTTLPPDVPRITSGYTTTT